MPSGIKRLPDENDIPTDDIASDRLAKRRKKDRFKRSDRVSLNGVKIGRKRKYKSKADAKKARQLQQRDYCRAKRAKEKAEAGSGNIQKKKKKTGMNVRVWGNEKEEGEEEEEEMNEEEEEEEMNEEDVRRKGAPQKDSNVVIDIDDEEDVRRKSVLSQERAEAGELVFEQIEKFGQINNVAYDGNCGYTSVIASLKYANRCCREDVRELRRDIRDFVSNHKEQFCLITEEDKDAIFEEKIKYTGKIGTKRWMDGSIAGPVVAALYNVIVYVYSKKDGEVNRTTVFRPSGTNSMKVGFISMMKEDSHRATDVVRLFNEKDYHYQWVSWGRTNEVKTEREGEGVAKADGEGEAKAKGEGEREAKGEAKAKGEGEAKKEGKGEGEGGGTRKEAVINVEEFCGWNEDEHGAARAKKMLKVRRSKEEMDASRARDSTVGLEDGRPYPPCKAGKTWGEECLALDRKMGGTRIASSTIDYPAKLGIVFFQNNRPSHAIVSWDGYEGRRNQYQLVPYNEIKFISDRGRGKRNRVKTDNYTSESGASLKSVS